MATDSKDLRTQLIHAGRPRERINGALVTPIFQASTYEQQGELSYFGVPYHRLNNSANQLVAAGALASIACAEDGVVTSSGMAAISATLTTLLRAGDHILVQRGVYGGTQGLLRSEFQRLGVSIAWIDGDLPNTWKTALQPRSKLIFVETMTNPLLEICELEAAAAFARDHGLISIVDNTFATPINLRPIERFGFDLEIHSATKYLGGHSDLTAGVVLGKEKLIAEIRRCMGHLGCCLGPQDCFLLERSLKTLNLRMRAHNGNGRAISEFLEQHDRVGRLFYPTQTATPHKRAWFEGFAGVLSFELADGIDSLAFLERLELVTHAVSLGGVESLATCPAKTTHASLSADEQLALNIRPNCIRLSVGLEAPQDITADLDQALRA